VIAAKVFGLLSAALGAGGTLLLFFGSFAYEGFTPYSNQQMIDAQTKRNKRRGIAPANRARPPHAQFCFSRL
jgi:hypothetical protein